MTMMAIGSVAAPIVGGLVGNLMGSSDRKRQRAAMAEAMRALQSVGAPPDLSKEIIYKELERAGILTPELEKEIQVAESEMGKLQEKDSSLRDTQKQALERLKQQAQSGLTAEDRAALNQVRGEVQRDSEAKRQQIMQTMQSRGMGGSGAELMSALQSAQGAADQAATGSDVVMAQAQQRALQALSESGRMAGDVRGQDFGIDSARAQALDERNRMLAQNSVARQAGNVNRLNTAQMANLAEQQRIQDANAQMANAEKLRQVQEQGALFDRRLGQAQGIANAQLGQASFAGQQAAQKQQMGSSIGSGLGTVGTTLMGNEKFMNSLSSPAPVSAPSSPMTSSFSYNPNSFGSSGNSGLFIGSDENMKTNIDYTDEDVTIWMDRISKLLKGKK